MQTENSSYQIKIVGYFRRSQISGKEKKYKVEDIEITSWKARAYGIFTRVGEVSEIERVSAANE